MSAEVASADAEVLEGKVVEEAAHAEVSTEETEEAEVAKVAPEETLDAEALVTVVVGEATEVGLCKAAAVGMVAEVVAVFAAPVAAATACCKPCVEVAVVAAAPFAAAAVAWLWRLDVESLLRRFVRRLLLSCSLPKRWFSVAAVEVRLSVGNIPIVWLLRLTVVKIRLIRLSPLMWYSLWVVVLK